MTKNLVFIDSRIADYQALIADLSADTGWVLLDADKDGVVQMQAALVGYSGLDSIHIVSHGSAGILYLGSTALDQDNLNSSYASQLREIGESLSTTGDMLLYGCNVAQGEVGQAFVSKLASLTGADVAASTDLTGAVALGGDWVLEEATEHIEATGLADSDLAGLLAVNSTPIFLVDYGKVTTDSGYAQSVTLQANGKILVAGSNSGGEFSLARYDVNGSLDTSFDNDGNISISFGNDYKYFTSYSQGVLVTVQADGSILVAGSSSVTSNSNSNFGMARYYANGSLDASFDGDGKVTTDFGGYDYVKSITLQADDKILVAGYGYGDGTNYDFVLARYNANGSLDTSFDSDGKIITAISTGHDYVDSVTVQADGKILVAGSSSWSFAMARYNANGSLDTSFDGDGKVATTDFNAYAYGQSVTVQADGKILVVGTIGGNFAMVRYNTDGSLDTSFDSDGKIITTPSFGSGRSVAIQADGKIIVAGSYSSNARDFALTRYNVDGSLDTSFDIDGNVTTDFGLYDDAYSVTIQADGKILVAGSSSFSGTASFALARYNIDGSLDPTFGSVSRLINNMQSYTEHGVPVLLDSMISICDYELAALNSGNGNYSGSSVTLARHGGLSGQDVFYASGNLSFTDGDAVLSGIVIGTVSNGGGMLTITFNANATQTLINQALSSITYANASNTPPASVQIDWIFNDGNTSEQGTGGALSATGSTTVQIVADTIAPTVSIFSPTDGATGVSATSNIGVTFSEAIQRGPGSIVLKNATGTTIETFDATSSDRLSISDSTLTIDPTNTLANGTKYYVTFASGTIKDLSGNSYAGTSTYDFTTWADTTAPTVSSFSPADGATGVSATSNIVLTFSEAIQRGTGSIVLKNAAGTTIETFDAATSERLSISGSTLAIDPTSNLVADSTKYYVTFASGSIKDLYGNAYTGTSIYDFTTGDTTAPTVSFFSPTDGATGVSQIANIVLTFSEAIQRGIGSMVLTNAAAQTIETFDAASSSRLSISGSTLTIDPTSNLAGSTNYYVAFASGTIKDLSGNAYAGTSTYDFTTVADTTAPTISSFSPTDGATGVSATSNIGVTFSEAIQRGSGSIVLKNAAGTTIETFDAATSDRLSISDSTLTIDPTNTLANGTNYYITFASGTIKDLSGNSYAGTSTYDFTTWADTTAPTVSSFSPVDGATGVSTTANIVLTFNEEIQRGTGSIVLTDAAGTTIETFDAATSNRLSIAGSTLTIDPYSPLDNGTHHHVTFASGTDWGVPWGTVNDLAGNAYTGTSTYDFTTVADSTAPVVYYLSPTDGVTGAPTAESPLSAIAAAALTGWKFDASSWGYGWNAGYANGEPVFWSYDPQHHEETLSFRSNGQIYAHHMLDINFSIDRSDYSGQWSIAGISIISDTVWQTEVIAQFASSESHYTFLIDKGVATWQYDGTAFANRDFDYTPSSRIQDDVSGSGNDVLDSSAAAATMGPYLFGLDGNDTLIGNDTRADYLFGGSGNDSIQGRDGDDFLYGDEFLYGQAGDDVIDGGEGTDTAVYFCAAHNYTITQAGVPDHYTIAGPEGTDQLIGIEYLQFGDAAPGPIESLIPHANNDPTVFIPTGVSTSADIVLYFSEAIQGGSGDIVLKNAAGTTIETFNVASSSRLSISDSTLTIDPTSPMANGTDYYVTLGAGTIRDLAGNVCAVSTYDFTVEAVTVSTGTAGNDMIHCGVANEIMDGGVGIDTAMFSCNHSDCTISKTADGFTLSGGGNGTDTLSNIERLQFADCHLALDLDGNAGSTAKILGAVFGSASVSNRTYAGIGIGLLDGGMSYEDLTALAVNAAGASTPQQVVNLLWTNVVGSAPSAGQSQPFVDMLNGGMTIGQLGVLAADTGMNQTNINMLGLMQTGLEYV